MSTALPKIAGVFTVVASTGFTIERTDIVTVARTVTLTEGDYYVTGDGTGTDLLQLLIDECINANAGEYANISFVLDADTGIVSAQLGPGETADLIWAAGAGATDLQDFLRFEDATTEIPASDATAPADFVSGTRAYESGFHPVNVAVDDLERRGAIATQSRSDAGHVNTVHFATRTEHTLTLHASANPYDTVYNEYHALESLYVDHMQKGRRIRYYRDKTNASPYAAVTNPQGYLVLVAAFPLAWDPISALLDRGWYQHFHFELDLFQYVA